MSVCVCEARRGTNERARNSADDTPLEAAATIHFEAKSDRETGFICVSLCLCHQSNPSEPSNPKLGSEKPGTSTCARRRELLLRGKKTEKPSKN